jgi:hypothetical protein
MSLRNRARALQKKTGLTYQQALQRVRALGERPARLRRETGWSLEVCDRFLVDGRAPVVVVEAPRSDAPFEVLEAYDVGEQIQLVCEVLRTTSAARGVALVDLCGHVIVRVRGALDAVVDNSEEVVQQPVMTGTSQPHATLVVTFHRSETSLGLVRLRAAKAARELAPLLDENGTPTMPPFGGGGGEGGVPHELRVVEPVPAPHPKKKPTPIGRKRLRRGR